MTTEQNRQNTSESQQKNMQTENELLLVQIHQLEEELEHYFKRNQELEKGQSAKSGSGELGISWVDDELPDALAEIQRLHTLIKVLQKTHQLETENALNVKLGNILIQAVDSPGNFITVPGKVGKIWRESSRKNPPKALGGKDFDKVITAYSDGGFKSVEKLFTGLSLAPALQANAYTALARHLMKSDRAAAAEAARRAYEIDPKPFRLKWLAFKLHEAGDVLEAEAMLDILPTGITFSESESRQAVRLRNEAKHVRQHEAKQKTRFSERRAEVEKQLASQVEKLKQKDQESELLLQQVFQVQTKLESSYAQCKAFEQEKDQLEQEIDLLKQAQKQEEEENKLLLHQFYKAQEEFESQYAKYQTLEKVQTKLEEEKTALLEQKDLQANLAVDLQSQVEQLMKDKAEIEEKLGREIDILKQAQTKLEEEKTALLEQKDLQANLAVDLQSQVEQLMKDKAEIEEKLGCEIDIVKQAQTKLEEEKEALLEQKDEQANLAADLQSQVEQLMKDKAEIEEKLGREIDIVKQAQTKLEEEKTALLEQKDLQANLAVDLQSQVEQLMKDKAEIEEKLGREIDILKQAQTKLEEEKTALLEQKDEQANLAADLQSQVEQLMKDKAEIEEKLGREIDILKQAQTKLEEEKTALVEQKDEQVKLSADLQLQVDQLVKDKTEIEEKFGREIDILKKAQTKLEEEKAVLAGQKDEQAKLVTKGRQQIDELRQQVKTKQDSEAELLMRQNVMQEEIVRAEAQLELIKDMLYREQGL
jgi:hypothetical protein